MSTNSTEFQEDSPGNRYGHSLTLIEMHPPRLLLYGGMIGLTSYEFEEDLQQQTEPDTDTHDDGGDGDGAGTDEKSSFMIRHFMNNRRKGKSRQLTEETDNGIYFLELNSDSWKWSKPLISVSKTQSPQPQARAEHSTSKIPNTNDVMVFGGWTDRPCNELWRFNYVDMEWKAVITSGIQPRSRYRHTSEILLGRFYVLGNRNLLTLCCVLDYLLCSIFCSSTFFCVSCCALFLCLCSHCPSLSHAVLCFLSLCSVVVSYFISDR